MDLISLLVVFLPQILECLNVDGEDKVFERLRRRPAAAYFPAKRAARSAGCSSKEARQCAREAVDTLRDMSDEDLRDLIRESKDEE